MVILTEKASNGNSPIWVSREYSKCSGCRKCEIACSLSHENKIWPEASRVRVFMLVPGTEFPHLCTQCEDYPCVAICPFKALDINKKTSAVTIDQSKCTGCGKCVDACPGKVPHIHPTTKKILICDLCEGNPQCAKVCKEGGWNCLRVVARGDHEFKLFARPPEETAKALATKLYGEKAEEFL